MRWVCTRRSSQQLPSSRPCCEYASLYVNTASSRVCEGASTACCACLSSKEHITIKLNSLCRLLNALPTALEKIGPFCACNKPPLLIQCTHRSTLLCCSTIACFIQDAPPAMPMQLWPACSIPSQPCSLAPPQHTSTKLAQLHTTQTDEQAWP